jgi:hypothetical protein
VNAHLPEGYIALDTVRLDGGLEVDVGIEEEVEPAPGADGSNGAGGTAVATARSVYTPPAATGTAEYEFPDVIELRVSSETGGRLVGAVELVSPGNKDREQKREALLAKCIDYIAGGACVVVVDVVTERCTNLHNEIVDRIGGPDALLLPEDSHLYTATYRPLIRKKKFQVDVWVQPLRVGEVLPTMPLRVVSGLFVPVELEEAYVAACRGRKFRA